MARIRTIKPEFFRHEELYEAEKKTQLPLRVAFAGLFTIADREGRFRWKPNTIKFDVLPYDEVDMELVLSMLWKNGFIRKYEVDGKYYGLIPSFKEHQVINNREAKSTLPQEPPENALKKEASFTRHGNYQGEGKGREGREKEGNIQKACEAIAEIFGREWEPDPENRMPDLANWYNEILNQAEILVRNYSPPEIAAQQVSAYIKYCKNNNRKTIGLVFKAAETILSADWMTLNGMKPIPKGSKKFEEAERNKTLWTENAWVEFYAKQIKNDREFQQHFKITNHVTP